MNSLLKIFAPAGIVAFALALAAQPAGATGTVTITQADGAVGTYPSVRITVNDNKLYVTSQDQKGTLVIDRAACSYQGEIYVCLPTAVTLMQNGKSSPLDLQRGTVYVNRTNADQTLPLSSWRLPPNGIVLSLTTDVGTFINMTGTIDEVKK